MIVKEYTWEPVCMTELKEIKQAIVAYRIHSPFIKEMPKTRALSNKAMSQD